MQVTNFYLLSNIDFLAALSKLDSSPTCYTTLLEKVTHSCLSNKQFVLNALELKHIGLQILLFSSEEIINDTNFNLICILNHGVEAYKRFYKEDGPAMDEVFKDWQDTCNSLNQVQKDKLKRVVINSIMSSK
jgi:hypothetical protein